MDDHEQYARLFNELDSEAFITLGLLLAYLAWMWARLKAVKDEPLSPEDDL